jgi:dihydroorotase
MPHAPFDLIIRGGTVVWHAGRARTDIGIRAGRFAAIDDLGTAEAAQVIDARGLHVLPGVIDSQVHFREPGLEHKEDLHSGTAGAALGGVTAVFEMPNTKPSMVTADGLADKLRRAAGRAWVDHAFYMGGNGEADQDLARLERLPGCCGVKIFMGSSTGTLLVEDDERLERVVRAVNRRMAVHCEDEPRLRARRALVEAPGARVHLHPVWRDEQTALLATSRLLRLAVAYRKRVHVLHVTTAQEMALLRQHRDLATVEVLPQHLVLSAPDCYDRLGSYAQMNPPIRGIEHQEALWAAVRDGTVDVLGSDHAPHTRSEKEQAYPASPSGMPGVQTLLPLMLDAVQRGRLTLERLVDLTSAGPQRIFGLAAKGRIAAGYDADLTLVDLERTHTFSDAEMATKAGWSPFTGMTVRGFPVATIIRGAVVMREGALQGQPIGRPLRFVECLPPAADAAPAFR